MTREQFIKKWLGNKDYQYTEQNRDLMRDDLDKVINKALCQPAVISCVCPNEIKTGTVSIDCCNLCGKPDEDWWGKH
jgi:hypothetical protein